MTWFIATNELAIIDALIAETISFSQEYFKKIIIICKIVLLLFNPSFVGGLSF